MENGYNIGGEQSGHVIFLDDNTTGDGLLSALHLLEVMVETGKPLSELAQVMEVLPAGAGKRQGTESQKG